MTIQRPLMQKKTNSSPWNRPNKMATNLYRHPRLSLRVVHYSWRAKTSTSSPRWPTSPGRTTKHPTVVVTPIRTTNEWPTWLVRWSSSPADRHRKATTPAYLSLTSGYSSTVVRVGAVQALWLPRSSLPSTSLASLRHVSQVIIKEKVLLQMNDRNLTASTCSTRSFGQRRARLKAQLTQVIHLNGHALASLPWSGACESKGGAWWAMTCSTSIVTSFFTSGSKMVRQLAWELCWNNRQYHPVLQNENSLPEIFTSTHTWDNFSRALSQHSKIQDQDTTS